MTQFPVFHVVWTVIHLIFGLLFNNSGELKSGLRHLRANM
jgi:hypothetical protein